jgi:tRNA(Ile)-lysidine synthase
VIGLAERVAQTVERYQMFTSRPRVGVAVSGGADSVCLLHILHELAPRWDLRLSVLHLNHKLRGEDSQLDAEFVACLAAKLGLPAVVREADVGAAPGNLEQAGREARLRFFHELIGATIDRVATGHTKSDQAETVLFRFLRGAGTGGLSGILPVTAEGVVRPLLEVERSETEEYLTSQGIPWREDGTNESRRFARNRIRHELLPQLEREWNPRIVDVLAHTADWARAEEEWWAAEVDRLGVTATVEGAWIRSLPVALARRLIRRVIQEVKGNLRGIDFEHVESILRLAARSSGHGRVRVPGVEVRRSFDWLCFAIPRAEIPYAERVNPPVILQPTGTSLRLSLEIIDTEERPNEAESLYNEAMGCLDWGRLSGSLELRNWRPGDRYQPVGSTVEIKIKTLFQKFRIPSWDRSGWKILTDGNSIIWARRFGPASRVAATAGTKVILAIGEID